MKMRIYRTVLAALLAAVLAVGSAVLAFASADIETSEDVIEMSEEAPLVGLSSSGSCGSNATYRWNSSTGELVISGSGSIEFSDFFSQPFRHNTQIKSVVINEGITKVGMAAFQGSTNIKKLTLPVSLKEIMSNAFNNIPNLKVYYKGSRESFWNIDVADSNQGLLQAELHFSNGKQHMFKDVSNYSVYYYNAVDWAATKRVINGIGDEFAPNRACTRAMIVTMLYNMAGSPTVNNSISFKDVKKGAWYYNAVRWAVANGITKGYGSGSFQPDAICTRAMVVTFIHNYAGGTTTPSWWGYKKPFPDVKKSDWFYNSVNWAHCESQIVNGKGDGKFHPYDPCTRGQVAVILFNYYNKGTSSSPFDQFAE